MPSTRRSASKSFDGAPEELQTEQITAEKRKSGNKPEHDAKRKKITGNDNSPEAKQSSNNRETIEHSSKRAAEMPASIIEKGIIYFLTRSRIDTEEPETVADLQRTYFILRPLAKDAKLGEDAIPDAPAARLITVPKKTFPKSHKDKFMVFVESTKKTMAHLKDEFFQGSEYETKTMGMRKEHPVTVIGEGVYAITLTGRTSHLTYILAIPSEPGKIQTDLGIRDKGSFVISLKNPTIKGPQNAQLPESPDFPKAILDEFKGLRWIPVQKPDHLDYPSAQLLLIGEGQGNFGSAMETTEADNKDEKKDDPERELEKLEGEEEFRIDHLHGDNSVFDDLHVSKNEFQLKSTW